MNKKIKLTINIIAILLIITIIVFLSYGLKCSTCFWNRPSIINPKYNDAFGVDGEGFREAFDVFDAEGFKVDAAVFTVGGAEAGDDGFEVTTVW